MWTLRYSNASPPPCVALREADEGDQLDPLLGSSAVLLTTAPATAAEGAAEGAPSPRQSTSALPAVSVPGLTAAAAAGASSAAATPVSAVPTKSPAEPSAVAISAGATPTTLVVSSASDRKVGARCWDMRVCVNSVVYTCVSVCQSVSVCYYVCVCRYVLAIGKAKEKMLRFQGELDLIGRQKLNPWIPQNAFLMIISHGPSEEQEKLRFF